MAPKARQSGAPAGPAIGAEGTAAETGTPPKTKAPAKRNAKSISSADPLAAPEEPAKRSKMPTGPSIMQMLRRPITATESGASAQPTKVNDAPADTLKPASEVAQTEAAPTEAVPSREPKSQAAPKRASKIKPATEATESGASAQPTKVKDAPADTLTPASEVPLTEAAQIEAVPSREPKSQAAPKRASKTKPANKAAMPAAESQVEAPVTAATTAKSRTKPRVTKPATEAGEDEAACDTAATVAKPRTKPEKPEKPEKQIKWVERNQMVESAAHGAEDEIAIPPQTVPAMEKAVPSLQKALEAEHADTMELKVGDVKVPTKEETTPSLQKELEGEPAETVQLKVGDVTYRCLCTRDSGTAAAWAEVVTRDIEASVEGQQAVGVLGVDCEWSAPWHRGPGVPDRLATLQFFHHGSTGKRALVFSVAGLSGELPPSVKALLGDSRLAKVGVNIAGDASRLVRDFGCPVRGLFDLANLNKKPDQKLRKAVSLEDVVRTHCPASMHIAKGEAIMTKGVRTSNWEAWPLSAEQIDYAAKDAALGVMAFMFKFEMDGSQPQLSKLAVDALVDLGEANSESIAKAKSVAVKKNSVLANESEQGSEPKSDDVAGKDAESTPTAKGKRKKKDADPAADAKDADLTPEEQIAKKQKKDDMNQHFFVAMRNSALKAPNIGKKDHPKGPSDALGAVCIVVSGILDSFERADMEKYVKDHGGRVSKSVTKAVTHLVTDHGEAGPSKVAKCKELGIPCVSEDLILQLVRDKMA